MKKDRNYWLERGKEFDQKEGFVCLGTGMEKELDDDYSDFNNPLRDQLGTFVWLASGRDFSRGWKGNSDVGVYYIEKETFDSIFPPKTKQDEIAELLEKVEKLKQEIEEEKKEVKVGDVLFAKLKNDYFIFKVSKIEETGYFTEKYYHVQSGKNYSEGLFPPYLPYEITKLDL